MRWGKHLSMAHADIQMSALLEECGPEGYGIYWLIWEDIASIMESGKMDPRNVHSISKWAEVCHCSTRVWTRVTHSLEKKALIFVQTFDKRVQITIPNILKYKDEYSKKSGHSPEQDRDRDRDREHKSSGKEKHSTRQEHIPETDSATEPVAGVFSLTALDPDKDLAVRRKRVEVWFRNEFWPTYPLKRGSKAKALAACKKIFLAPPEEGKEQITPRKVMDGLRAQLPEMLELKKTYPRGIPHGENWIKAHRWEDEVLPVQVGPKLVTRADSRMSRIEEAMIAGRIESCGD